MKTKLLFLFAGVMALTFFSCENDEATNPDNTSRQGTTATNSVITGLTPCVNANLMAGQHYDAGDVNLYVDLNNVYIEYTTTGNWFIKKTHLYVGNCQSIPTNNGGSPIPGQFPISTNYITGTQSVVYTIPKASLPECFCVAAHAEVIKVQNGVTVQTETAWAAGQRFNNRNWATYFSSCQSDCFDIEDYYFGNKNQ